MHSINPSLPLDAPGHPLELLPGFVLLRGLACSASLLPAIESIAHAAPFRRMIAPGGRPMSVAMTNSGSLGWTSDTRGYRYSALDPRSGAPWPAIPSIFLELADAAASTAGFGRFVPDACLVNRYEPGSRLGLHRDEDERDPAHPIVSVSLGASARFSIGGLHRRDPVQSLVLHDGDVLVWGGPSRMRYHAAGTPRTGTGAAAVRYNLTLRRAG